MNAWCLTLDSIGEWVFQSPFLFCTRDLRQWRMDERQRRRRDSVKKLNKEQNQVQFHNYQCHLLYRTNDILIQQQAKYCFQNLSVLSFLSHSTIKTKVRISPEWIAHEMATAGWVSPEVPKPIWGTMKELRLKAKQKNVNKTINAYSQRHC